MVTDNSIEYKQELKLTQVASVMGDWLKTVSRAWG